MHIVHLAVAVDSISSVILDITDDAVDVIDGSTRDRRLLYLWDSYHMWCEASRLLSCYIVFIFLLCFWSPSRHTSVNMDNWFFLKTTCAWSKECRTVQRRDSSVQRFSGQTMETHMLTSRRRWCRQQPADFWFFGFAAFWKTRTRPMLWESPLVFLVVFFWWRIWGPKFPFLLFP